LLLGQGAQRFTGLKRSIEGISQRMLTLTLRRLEEDGLVSRHVEPTIPPAVHYELTPLGHSLTEALQPLMNWAQEHRASFNKARR
jgi:DNA-binding HxlR family transcriptional regulator